ncbi:MAG TPA: M14 family metallocarboxypeptidase [Chthoniobacteraceae bacterium]|nr:M14 family metallocarboxypeptidase [Chthoniobacteraceae bacterium]
MNPFLYACHDPVRLERRWRRVARAARLEMEVLAEADGYEVFYLRSRDRTPDGGIYLSAGIHGDEAAGTEGLIGWAEENVAQLRQLGCLIFPCLNPWGLANNSRFDRRQNDLNRAFHHDENGQVRALKALVRPYRFSLALMLHEDYDGHGFYLYEIKSAAPTWGDDLLRLVEPLMPIETRRTIDGRRVSRTGLVQRRFKAASIPLTPEALHLHLHHSRRTFTIETPSEFALETRVKVQKLVIGECVNRAIAERRERGWSLRRRVRL